MRGIDRVLPSYDIVGAVAMAVTVAGIASSVLITYRLCKASTLLGAKGLCVNAYSFMAYAAGLVIEFLALTGVIISSNTGMSTHRAIGRPELVTRILSSRGELLAAPFYAISYSLAAAALYIEHVPVEDEKRKNNVLLLAVPFIVQLYVDYNLVLLLILLVSLLLVFQHYAPLGLRTLAFYAIVAMSHVVALLLPILDTPIVIYVSTMLRGIAPTLFIVTGFSSRKGG